MIRAGFYSKGSIALARENRTKITQEEVDSPMSRPNGERLVLRGRRHALKAKDNSQIHSADQFVKFVLARGGRSSSPPSNGNAHQAQSPRKNGAQKTRQLRFIDLFSGIGGSRLAFERAGAKCVFSSDWDKFSRQTYAANFGEEPAGDINAIPVADIPPFDILCGGFPCQPFSLAGVSKKNSLGKKHGFDDERQGNLFSPSPQSLSITNCLLVNLRTPTHGDRLKTGRWAQPTSGAFRLSCPQTERSFAPTLVAGNGS